MSMRYNHFIVEVLHFFLVFWFISIIESVVLKSPIDCWIIVYSILSVFLCAFWSFGIRCMFVYNHFVFLMDWPSYHYKIYFFVSSNNFCFKGYIVWCWCSCSKYLLSWCLQSISVCFLLLSASLVFEFSVCLVDSI